MVYQKATEVEIKCTTTGEFDACWTVWLINPDDPTDNITDLYDAETERDARNWARQNGYKIRDEVTKLVEDLKRMDERVDAILLGNDSEVILELVNRLTNGFLNMKEISYILDHELAVVGLKNTSEHSR